VRQNNPEGVTEYCKPGDVISSADLVTYKSYFEAFGWLKLEDSKEAKINISSVHIRHDDETGAARMVLPDKSLVLDIFVECTEDAAGDPDIDFGEFGGDTDGIIDGLGTSGICDTTDSNLDTAPDYKGLGVYLISLINQNDTRVKKRKYYSKSVMFENVCNSAGTAGEWNVHVMYIILPDFE